MRQECRNHTPISVRCIVSNISHRLLTSGSSGSSGCARRTGGVGGGGGGGSTRLPEGPCSLPTASSSLIFISVTNSLPWACSYLSCPFEQFLIAAPLQAAPSLGTQLPSSTHTSAQAACVHVTHWSLPVRKSSTLQPCPTAKQPVDDWPCLRKHVSKF